MFSLLLFLMGLVEDFSFLNETNMLPLIVFFAQLISQDFAV